ncbi:MAG: hypothetical protein ABW189_05835 [Rickettsiales bacterium]
MLSSVVPRPAGFIKEMPGVPVFPGAYATESARPYNVGFMNGGDGMQAVYHAENASLPSLLSFYRNSMRDAGWQKYPGMELYRAPDGRQVHITFAPQSGGSYIRFKQGRDLISPLEWNYAFNKRQQNLYTPASVVNAAPTPQEDDDATLSASLF